MTPSSASETSPPPSLADLLQESFILVGLSCDSAEAAIRQLAVPLVETGCVEEAYADDVWVRERKFPTGLPTTPFAVALPHADPDHVLRPALGVGLLATPVEFFQMGSEPPIPLSVRIVFLLALKEREHEALFLRDLMAVLQTPGLLEALSQSSKPADVAGLLRAASASPGPQSTASE